MKNITFSEQKARLDSYGCVINSDNYATNEATPLLANQITPSYKAVLRQLAVTGAKTAIDISKNVVLGPDNAIIAGGLSSFRPRNQYQNDDTPGKGNNYLQLS